MASISRSLLTFNLVNSKYFVSPIIDQLYLVLDLTSQIVKKLMHCTDYDLEKGLYF